MMPHGTPMQWPDTWKDPAALSLLKGTAIDYLMIGKAAEFDPIRAGAQRQGVRTGEPGGTVPGVTRIKGEWPGVRMSRDTGAGPTGVPWVDSNGWAIRLAAAQHPGRQIWV